MTRWVLFATSLICAWATEATAAPPPNGSMSSISHEEQDIYDAVLASWLDGERGRQLVNQNLGPPPSTSDSAISECAKRLVFPQTLEDEQPAKSLAGAIFKRSGIELIDGSQWRADDPGQAIAKGRSVDAAVQEGFSHSLISFSQIMFSRDHSKALLNFSMVCGQLCGSGNTFLMSKTGGHWAVLRRCGGWIS